MNKINMKENNFLFKSKSLMWLGIVVLALSTFTIVTADFAPVGLLTPMAKGLQQSESMIGLTVTLYSWTGAISGLIVVFFFGNMSKKILLASSIFIVLISNVLCATSTNYIFFVVARIIGGVGNGALWAMVFVVAMSLVPTRNIGMATSIVFGGVSAGNLLGVPISSFIGNALTWQMAFWMIVILSFISLLCILIFVPNVKTSNKINVYAFKKVFLNATLLRIYLAAFLTITAYFCAFTFVEPYLVSLPFISENMISVVLFIFGVAGLLGNFIVGVLVDRHLKSLVIFSTSIVAVTILMLGFYSDVLTQLSIMILISLWGLSISGVFIGFQTWLLRADPDNAFPASAVYSALFNSAIGFGALLGAWIVSEFNITQLITFSAVAIFVSLIPISMIPDVNKDMPVSDNELAIK